MAHILKADETILVMRRMKELYYPLLTVKYLPYIQSRWSVPCSLFPLPTAVRCRVLASAALMICVDCSFAFESVERERGGGNKREVFWRRKWPPLLGNGREREGQFRFRLLFSQGGFENGFNIEEGFKM